MTSSQEHSAGLDPDDATQVEISTDLESNSKQDQVRLWDAEGVRLVNGISVVGLRGDDDPLSPLNMSVGNKWAIVAVISSACFCVTACSSMVSSTYDGVMAEFNVSLEIATLGLSLFILGVGGAPLIVGPLSEFWGRRPVYVLSFVFFLAFSFLVAFFPNAGGWLAGRFLTGVSGAAFLSIAGGSVADLFAPQHVALPMAAFSVNPFLGPVFGPIISGFINQHLYWRWTWWIFIIWVAFELAAIVLWVPETFMPAILVKRAKFLRKSGRTDVHAPLELSNRSLASTLASSCATPFELMVLEPMALILSLWTSILQGILYMFFSAFDIVYAAHGFNLQSVGLSFIGLVIGSLVGVAAFPLWARSHKAVEEKTGTRPPPEEHLRKDLYAAVIIPASLFWFAWTSQPSIHWSVSMVATIPFGCGLIWAYQAVFTYLVDAFRPVAASAMSLNTAMRCSFAAGFPLFTHQMFHKLGTQWALSLCAFLCLGMSPFPFIFFHYGARLRTNSKFANTL